MKTARFIKDSFIYWLGRMGARAVSFLLLPIYTAYIVPTEWGILNLLMISGDLAVLLVLCQIPAAMYRFWVSAQNEDDKERLSGLGLVFPTLFSCLIFAPLYVFADSCASFMGIDGYGDYIRILLFTEQLAILLGVMQAEMRLRNEATLFAMLEIGQNFGSAALNIFFVVVFGWGIWGILLGQMLTFAVIVALLLPRFLRRARLNLDFRLLRSLLLFSSPLVPSALAMAAVHNIDRYFLQFMLGPETVGLYSIGYKFGTLVNMLILGPFLLIWEPKSYEIAQEQNASAKLGKVFTYLYALLLFMAVGLAGTAREMVTIMTAEKYHAAWPIVSLVAFSYVCFGMDSIVRVGLLLHKKTRVILLVVLAACAINIAGNRILIPVMGMRGAAWSTLGTFGFLVVMDALLACRYLPVSFEWKKITLVTATAAVVLGLLSAVHLPNVYGAVAVKATLLVVYPLSLLITGFISRENIVLLRDVLKSR